MTLQEWKLLGVQKYWAPPTTTSKELKRMKIEQAAQSGNYLWSEKFDGNLYVLSPIRIVPSDLNVIVDSFTRPAIAILLVEEIRFRVICSAVLSFIVT